MTCTHCKDEIETPHASVEHADLCCDCHDLACGAPVATINARREAEGKAPVEPWREPETTEGEISPPTPTES